MTKPLSPVDVISFRLDASEYPVVIGRVEGDYSVKAINAFENTLRHDSRVTSVTLGRNAGFLTYIVDTRPEQESDSIQLAS
jgi:hypothetical protein